MRKIIAVCFVCLMLVSCSQGAISSAKGGTAPAFTLTDINGDQYDSAQFAGKVVIMDFWATWCPPCRQEIPHFQELYERYKGQGLEVVGIALDQGGAADVKPFVKENGVTYPVLIGNREVVEAYGGVRSIPTTFVIDSDGKIVQKYIGYRSKDVFKKAIKGLL